MVRCGLTSAAILCASAFPEDGKEALNPKSNLNVETGQSTDRNA